MSKTTINPTIIAEMPLQQLIVFVEGLQTNQTEYFEMIKKMFGKYMKMINKHLDEIEHRLDKLEAER